MAFLKSVIKSQFFGNAHLFVGVPCCPYFSTLAFFFSLFFYSLRGSVLAVTFLTTADF